MAGLKALHPEIQMTLLPIIRTADEDDSDVLIFSNNKEHNYKTDQTVMHEEFQLLGPPGHPLYERESIAVA